MIFLYCAIGLFIFYSILITYYWWGWNSVPDFNPIVKNPSVRISVIIPARNEQENIAGLLQALKEQTYSQNHFEVIVIDDNSTDRTAEVVQQFENVRLIRLNETGINSYKKKAIETGIAAATGELVVTTDADCLPSSNWLQTIASFYEEKQAVFVAAPVIFKSGSSMLQQFQSLDFLILQGITAASVHKRFHNMCNGANLAYKRAAFYEVNGFAGIDDLASGDDMLLMNKIALKSPDRIFYLKSKDAIVTTQPMQTWKEFFNQRIRWASKATGYRNKTIFAVLLLVYLFNLSFLLLSVAGVWFPGLWTGLLYLLVLKIIIEFPFVYLVAGFFNKQKLMWLFPVFQPLHIIYTVIAGCLGTFGRYEWKGRKVK